jgi:hypothetical protein
LGDGIIELALLRRDPGDRSGLDHFGFEVEDSQTAVNRIKENFPDLMIRKSLDTVPFAEMRAHDPLGVSFDISQKGVIKGQATRYLPDYKEEGWEQPRHFHHIALRVANPARCAELFKKVFELRAAPDRTANGDICLTDGRSYLVLRACDTSSYNTMKNSIDHVGFKVENLETVKEDLDIFGKSLPLFAGPTIALPHRQFGKIAQRVVDDCALGKHAVCDPTGSLLDIAV